MNQSKHLFQVRSWSYQDDGDRRKFEERFSETVPQFSVTYDNGSSSLEHKELPLALLSGLVLASVVKARLNGVLGVDLVRVFGIPGYLMDKMSLPVTSLRFASHASNSFFTLGPLECTGIQGKVAARRALATANFVSAACRLVNPPPTTPGPRTHPATNAWIPRITLPPKGKTTAVVPVLTSNPTSSKTMKPTSSQKGEGHGHVTVTTMISTHDNSTVVTSVVKHKLKNGSKEGVTIHSSIHTGEGKDFDMCLSTYIRYAVSQIVAILKAVLGLIMRIKC